MTKFVVPQFYNVVIELEVKMFKKFINNKKEKIIAEAKQEAETIIENAKIEAQRLTCESELLKAIHQKSQEIKDETIKECKKLKQET